MYKKLTLSLIIFLFMAVLTNAQWNNVGGRWAFANEGTDTIKAQAHGLAVDPDGKVWIQVWSAINVAVSEGDTVRSVFAIRVFEPNGIEASFSPIFQITTGGGFVVDTLYAGVIGNPRGMRADNNGNILAVWGTQLMHRIDYKTGEGMDRVALGIGTSPCSPAVDNSGRIFVAPVVPGNPIQIYNPDFSFIGNAVDATKGFARTTMVSKDGNTVYHMAYTVGYVTVYNKPDVFSGYDSVGTILQGFAPESADWDPKSGLFWASAGSFTDKAVGYSNNTWYGYDLVNDAIVDSFKWQFTTPNSANERPRGLAFSPDGNTAYVTYFAASGPPVLQRFERDLTPVTMTFNVDMSVQIAEGLFTAGGTVALAGSFNGWSTTANVLTDPDGDNIYTTTVPGIEPGTRIFYKYLRNGSWEEGMDYPTPNGDREWVVTAGNNKTTAYFNNYLGSGIEVQFTFRCNMEVEKLKGKFNPATDVLSVRGSFNEFATTDVLAVTDDPNVYEAKLGIKVFEGDILDYQFGYGSEAEEMYKYTVKNDDITNAAVSISRGFNGIRLADVTEKEVTITFQVDMKNPINDVTKVAFEKIENVVIAGKASPLQWPSAGWPDSDQSLVKFLNDNGQDGDRYPQDSIWGCTVTFPAYTLMDFEYKYGANWGLASNGGSNDNEASTGVLHSMNLNKGISSATANDTWADMSPTKLDSIVSGVREISNAVPNFYNLEQNFPNPFNPTTNIRFSLPKAGEVSLKIYNVLGQEIMTLVNGFKNAGTFEATFDASKLSSGMYIYVLSSGKYVTSRKMMLVK